MTSPQVDDLVRVLRSFGVLTRAELRERSGSARWPDQSFDAVLRGAIEEGSVKQLGDDLFELGDSAPDPNEGRFDPT
jgi:hypothetical protein